MRYDDEPERINGDVVRKLVNGDQYYLGKLALTAEGWVAVAKAAECILRANGKWGTNANRVVNLLKKKLQCKQED
jgi:hypothetical protein